MVSTMGELKINYKEFDLEKSYFDLGFSLIICKDCKACLLFDHKTQSIKQGETRHKTCFVCKD